MYKTVTSDWTVSEFFAFFFCLVKKKHDKRVHLSDKPDLRPGNRCFILQDIMVLYTWLLAFAKWNTLRKSKYTTNHKNISFKTKQKWKQVPNITNINIICKLLNYEVWYMNLTFKQLRLSYLAAQMCCARFFFLVVFL